MSESLLPGLVQAWFVWEQGAREDRMGIHAQIQGGTDQNTPELMQALADQLDEEAGPELKLLQSANADYRRVEVHDLSPTTLISVSADANAGAGSRGTPAATALSSLTITKQSGLQGRGNRGRMFVGGLAAADVTQEATEWTSTVRDLAQTFGVAVLSAIEFSGYAPVIWHRGGDTVTYIPSVRANLEIYRQRRRVLT